LTAAKSAGLLLLKPIPNQPGRHGRDLHHRRDSPRRQIGDCVADLGKRIGLDRLDLAPLLHRDRHIVIGGGRLNADRGVLQPGDALDLRRLAAIHDQAQRRRHVGIGPGEGLAPRRRDRDPADNAVVTTILHLLQHHFPLRIDEFRSQMQPLGDLVDQIDFEPDLLTVRDEFKGRVDEIRADPQDPRGQRLQVRFSPRRRECRGQQYGDCDRHALKPEHDASPIDMIISVRSEKPFPPVLVQGKPSITGDGQTARRDPTVAACAATG
jgi:hypothetical protein